MSSKTDLVELVLTCGSWQEAQRIADDLLQKYLVEHVELLEVDARLWRDIGANEVKLIMQTMADKFVGIEQVVTELYGKNKSALQQVALPTLSSENS